MSTLVDLWSHTEQRQPDKVAVVAGERSLTYREMGRQIRTLSANLARRWQIGPGEVVALLSPNCPEFIVSYFAAIHLRAVVQPVDERLTPEEMASILRDSGARNIIVHGSLFPKFDRFRGELPALDRVLGIGATTEGVESFEAWANEGSELSEPAGAVPDDPAELMYTSGTMGEPKGVLRSHANVRAAARNSIRGFGYRGDDVIGITMPMSHSSALNSQMMPLVELGGRLVLFERFEPAALVAAIRSEQITCMRAVPAMLRQLLTLPDFRADELPSLRLLVNSSAPIDPATYLDLKHRFEEIQVMNSYGLTEASTCTVLPNNQALVRPDSIGVPIEGVEMRLLDDEGHPIEDEQEGEICISGPHVFIGYRGRPEATREVLIDGWLYTGDLGHRDSEGFYYLHGRVDDVINCGGRKVVPLEVENCILQLPQVADVAVVGVPHRILGQVAKAFVVARQPGDFDPKEVSRHCTRQLASYKVPFYVEIVLELPKNSVGKTLRRKLTERVNEQQAAIRN